MSRRLLLVLGTLFVFLVAAPVAAAQDDQLSEARAEIDDARALVEEAVDAVARGDREEGYRLAREAYLDNYERVEIPLRLRDPNLVLDVEFDFAELRNGIRDGAPLGEIEETAANVQEGLDASERALSDTGVAAPLLAFGFSFMILFREGLEAVLIIAVLLGSLEAGRARSFKRPLAAGAGLAIVATAVTWVLAALVLDIAPVQRELLEGVTALVAVAVLFAITFWLVARLEHRRWMEFMRARVAGAIAAGSALAFAGLGFTAIYREGFELVLFYQALLLFAEGLLLWILLGMAVAAVALVAAGYGILRLGKRLPLKPMLIVAASTLLLLSVAFAGNAVRALQEGDWLPVTPIEGEWARLPIFLAELTGIHPTREGLIIQAALLGVYALGAAYVFGFQRVRRRRAAEAASA
jgi:high-affinity iron transporter